MSLDHTYTFNVTLPTDTDQEDPDIIYLAVAWSPLPHIDPYQGYENNRESLLIVAGQSGNLSQIMHERMQAMIDKDLVIFHLIVAGANLSLFFMLAVGLMCFLRRRLINPIILLTKQI